MSLTQPEQERRLSTRRRSGRGRLADGDVPTAQAFLAGQDAGARTSACVARLAAIELMEGSRWWNRRRRRVMARALVACAEELELTADASGTRAAALPA